MIIAAWLLAIGANTVPSTQTQPAGSVSPPANICPVIRQSDLEANRALRFHDFDQLGATPTAARALAMAACYDEAVAVSADYLVHGPILTDFERNIIRWHMGQYLASSGREREAALLIASTRRGPSSDSSRPGLDWDSYVVGTYAFLTKDRRLLDAMSAKLGGSADEGNRLNAQVLHRLQKCFGETYRIAGADPRCAAE